MHSTADMVHKKSDVCKLYLAVFQSCQMPTRYISGSQLMRQRQHQALHAQHALLCRLHKATQSLSEQIPLRIVKVCRQEDEHQKSHNDLNFIQRFLARFNVEKRKCALARDHLCHNGPSQEQARHSAK